LGNDDLAVSRHAQPAGALRIVTFQSQPPWTGLALNRLDQHDPDGPGASPRRQCAAGRRRSALDWFAEAFHTADLNARKALLGALD
jgi:hypothetical protein